MTHHQEELLLNDYYTIAVVFNDSTTAKRYTYKVDNSMEIEIDDMIVVKVSDKLKLAKVVNKHTIPNINFNSSIVYQYIVCKVDTTKCDELKERSAKVSARTKLKKEMLEAFVDENGIKLLAEAGVKVERL